MWSGRDWRCAGFRRNVKSPDDKGDALVKTNQLHDLEQLFRRKMSGNPRKFFIIETAAIDQDINRRDQRGVGIGPAT